MSDNSNFLDLADYTGLLIDNTLSALIKSLESQIQWREQITAIDRMNNEEIYDSLTTAEIEDWLEDFMPDFLMFFEKWSEIKPEDKLDLLVDYEFEIPLAELYNEIGLEIPGYFFSDKIIMGKDYDIVMHAVRLHLVEASKSRLAMMKDMGLPALVADRVEIKSKMNLVSESVSEAAPSVNITSPKAEPVKLVAKTRLVDSQDVPATTRANLSKNSFKPVQNPRHTQLAKPVKTKIIGKLSDLEKIRTRIPATKTHSIKISASGTPSNTDHQIVNAEVSIILRSHFF